MKYKVLKVLLPTVMIFSLASCLKGANDRNSEDSSVISSIDNPVSSKKSSTESPSPYTHVHYFILDESKTIPATCQFDGINVFKCDQCGYTYEEYVGALGHAFVIEESTDATCTQPGYLRQKCEICGYIQEEQFPSGSHVFEKSSSLSYCISCNLRQIEFSSNDVTEESKSHLVYGNDGGARFWGQPIGNSMELDESGSASPDDHLAIYDKNQTGDFFEFSFLLNQEEAKKIQNRKFILNCDAKPADYMGQNGMDFWKTKGDASSDWTYGMYIDDDPEHYEEIVLEDGSIAKQGKIVQDFRYVLYVDNEIKELDITVDTPVERRNPRGIYTFPYAFNFHEGINTIRIVMAGGYRSTFYKFTFVDDSEVLTNHNYVAENKLTGSSLKPLTCTDCTNIGYQLDDVDLLSGQVVTEETNGSQRLGKNNIYDDIWDITGIEQGTYDIYLLAKCNSGTVMKGYWNSETAVALGDSTGYNGGEPLCYDYKFKVKIDENDYVNLGNPTDNYSDTGLNEKSMTWTNKSLARITIKNYSTRLTLHNMGNGYSMWIKGLRLVKVL